jgi:sucrose-phosphate synthase
MEDNEREVLTEMLLLMDRYDLYGRMAIPKRHDFATEVPELYRIAARSRGVFVNPAFTEPFGLTLIEAAATGLPVVSTEDGGPRDILENCGNGFLVDPTDPQAISTAIGSILGNRERWQEFSRNGIEGVGRHYTWSAHTQRFVDEVLEMVSGRAPIAIAQPGTPALGKRVQTAEWFLVTDIDNTLLGDEEGLAQLLKVLEAERDRIIFGVATGRVIESAREILEENGVPWPDFIISSVGSEIHLGNDPTPDRGWAAHIRPGWQRDRLEELLDEVEELRQQESEVQRPFKLSYYADPGFELQTVVERLSTAQLEASLVLSHGAYLDLLPARASKGKAIRYLAFRFDVPHRSIATCGDSGNDADMLSGGMRGIVVSNHDPDLEELRGNRGIHFSPRANAWGILEGLVHYGILDPDHLPQAEVGPREGVLPA